MKEPESNVAVPACNPSTWGTEAVRLWVWDQAGEGDVSWQSKQQRKNLSQNQTKTEHKTKHWNMSTLIPSPNKNEKNQLGVVFRHMVSYLVHLFLIERG